MSRSKKDILETESMLQRLTALLAQHTENSWDCYKEACALRRISITLQRWFELECGNGNDYGSWAIVRGEKRKLPDGTKVFYHDDDSKPFLEHHHYLHGKGKDYTTHARLPDREAGARKRLASILARYPGLTAYVQTDPRGCALYILKPGDVPDGADVSSYYSRGLAVYR